MLFDSRQNFQMGKNFYGFLSIQTYEQQKTEPQNNDQYQQRINRELHILYFFGLFAASMHLIVGLTWENVPINKENCTLPFPYMGGYLILFSFAFGVIFTYFLLMRRKEPDTPKYLKRFGITLCLVMTLVQIVLGAILPIKANDYHSSQSQLTGAQYSSVMLITVLDIMFVYVSIPHFAYLLFINCKIVKKMPEDKSQVEQQQGTDNEERIERPIIAAEQQTYFDHEFEPPDTKLENDPPSDNIILVGAKQEKKQRILRQLDENFEEYQKNSEDQMKTAKKQ